MKLFIFNSVLLLGVTVIKSKGIDEEAQAILSDSNVLSQTTEASKLQNKYVTKEVIMYLTPSQIKALNSGEAYITSHISTKIVPGGQELQQEYLFNLRNQEQHMKREDEPLQTIRQVEEISKENPLESLDTSKTVEKAPKEEKRLYTDIYFSQKPENKQLFFPAQASKIELDSSPWIPINPISYTKPENLLLTHSSHNQINPILGNNYLNINAFPMLPINLNAMVPVDNELKYSQNFVNAKNVYDNPEVNYHNEIIKQKSLAEIVAIANSLPVVAHSKISLRKHLPESTKTFKHLIVPLPLLFKSSNISHVNQPIPTVSLSPFFYSSLDLEKVNKKKSLE